MTVGLRETLRGYRGRYRGDACEEEREGGKVILATYVGCRPKQKMGEFSHPFYLIPFLFFIYFLNFYWLREKNMDRKSRPLIN